MLASFLKRVLFRGNRPDVALASNSVVDPAECRGILLAGKLDAAVECYQSYLALHPNDTNARNDMGVALQRLGRHEEALRCYETVMQAAPNKADAWYNAALIHHLRGHGTQAEKYYLGALHADPQHPEAHREYSMLRLVRGDFSESVWSSFRHRRNCEGFKPTENQCPASLWNGEPLEGKTILAYGEQGLGDEILFASCYPDIIVRAAQCIIETEPRLEKLFRRSFPSATVIGRQREAEIAEHYPAIAYKVPCGDLPLHFRQSLEAFPRRDAYLYADNEAVERWRRVLGGLGAGLKIGISWRGGTERTGQAYRSIDLEQWRAVLSIPGIHFVSLQYGECEADLAYASKLGLQVHHWPEAIADYDETAALVCALDCVITVTTSLAHLAGALGQTVWILTNTAPRWCYMAQGTTTPWYPSARISRQTRAGNWDEVMGQVAAALAQEPDPTTTGSDCTGLMR